MKYIYIRTNKINGKQYIGQTKNFQARERAWRKMKSIYGNKLLSEERNKYGLENFSVEILKECEDSESDNWERYYIKKFSTIQPNGYNFQNGGVKGFTYTESKETRIKKSLAKKGKAPKCVTFKTVYQYTLDGKLIETFNSTHEVERKLGFKHTNIARCCNGGFYSKGKWKNFKTYKGYIWSYIPL